MVLWGPPGCGKTTVARIISKMTKSRFVELSATSHGTADVKKAFEDAKGQLMLTGQKTIVFIDEIHRFSKTQQDLFLPYVEHGTIHLIGATTENPRCKVFVLKRLDQDQIESILTRGLEKWRGIVGTADSSKDKAALTQLAVYSDGDETVKGAFQKSHLLYDRNGDQHYDIISALHKSIRGSDANAALYWLGRMLVAGEDPLYIARRLVRCASEDIGLADNTALPLAMAAYNACEKIGMPECDTILAHLVVHLAETKKSVRSYKAYNLVKQTIRDSPAFTVPLHIRNAPTNLMKVVYIRCMIFHVYLSIMLGIEFGIWSGLQIQSRL
ncbi:DNA polymerase III, clamp loader complex, gamma/delta/delta subunit [Parasitella parasitica]|nr:DNA polymerase III, clamp loader complex, gamma/delta/delta subunit [Parasitella parasitica]